MPTLKQMGIKKRVAINPCHKRTNKSQGAAVVYTVTSTKTASYTGDFGMAKKTFYAKRSGSGSSRSKTKALRLADAKAYEAARTAAERKAKNWQRKQLRKAQRDAKTTRNMVVRVHRPRVVVHRPRIMVPGPGAAIPVYPGPVFRGGGFGKIVALPFPPPRF